MNHQDAYKSVFEALYHAAAAADVSLEICRFESDRFRRSSPSNKRSADATAIWFPADSASAAGKEWCWPPNIAEQKKIPYFGLCLGMQVMIVEFARNVLGLNGANSTEIDIKHRLSRHLHAQRTEKRDKISAARCASARTLATVKPGTLAFQAYGKKLIPSATATATNSITNIKKPLKKREWFFPEPSKTGSCARFRKSQTIPGCWACNSIQNSSQSLSTPILSFASSSTQRSDYAPNRSR